MKKPKALYGIVSEDKGVFTIVYEKHGGYINHTCQGSSFYQIFDGQRKTLPIIRYDLTAWNSAILKSDEYLCDESIPCMGNVPVTTKEYFKRLKENGTKIQKLAEINWN